MAWWLAYLDVDLCSFKLLQFDLKTHSGAAGLRQLLIELPHVI